MSTLKKIKEIGKDSFIYGLGSSISQLLSLFLVPLFTKALTPIDYGVLAIVGLFSQFTSPILSLGIDNALFRYFSQSENFEEESSWLSTATLIRTSVTLISLFFIYFSFPLLNAFLFEDKLTNTIFNILLVSVFIGSIGSIAEVVIRTQRKPKVMVLVQLIAMFLSLGLSIYLVLYLKWGVEGALIASLFGQILSAFFYSLYIKKFIKYKSFSLIRAKVLMRYALPYIPHKVQGEVMQLFSLFIVNHYMGIAIAGIYSVANKLVKPIYLITGSIQKAWVPYKFQLYKKIEDPKPFFRVISGNYWFILIYIWSLSSLLIPYIFQMLIDQRYHTGITYFPFLAFIPISQAFYYTVNTGFELKKSQFILPVASFFGMITVVAVSLSTVNYIAPYGPIISQSLSFLVISVITYKYAHKILPIDFPFLLTLIFLLLSIAVILFSYLNEFKFIITFPCLLLETIFYLFIILSFNKSRVSAIFSQLIKKIIVKKY